MSSRSYVGQQLEINIQYIKFTSIPSLRRQHMSAALLMLCPFPLMLHLKKTLRDIHEALTSICMQQRVSIEYAASNAFPSKAHDQHRQLIFLGACFSCRQVCKLPQFQIAGILNVL